MATVKVKICGLARRQDVDAAIDYGADAVGFIFGYRGSARNLEFEKLKELIDGIPPYVETVVVSPASNPELVRVMSEVRPTFIQLFGETNASLLHLKSEIDQFNVIQTIHLSSLENEESIIRTCIKVSKSCKRILLDSAAPIERERVRELDVTSAIPGGSGTVHDWKLSRKIRNVLHPFPIILAGGLNEKNVQSAIRQVRPYSVDVSSGVEIALGVKDRNKVKRFIENSKSVDYGPI